MVKVKIYGIYDGDNLVFSGSRSEIAKEFGLKLSSMSSYTTGRIRLNGKYDVNYLDEEYREIEYGPRNYKKYEPKPETEPNYKDNPLECLILHLKMYGNTLINFDPTKYTDDLKNAGFNVKITERQEHIERSKLTRRGRRRKPKMYYYVEAV